MHITYKQLNAILDDDTFLKLDSNDMLDWPCETKDYFVASYLAECSPESRYEITGEGCADIDVLKLYTNPEELLNDMKNTVYQYLENDEENGVLSLRSMIICKLELIRQEYYKERVIHERV